jgi:site-specific DNA-methyltransferase (adenine-specific)
MNFNIIQGDNRDTLKTIADNSIDAIITDPPYGIDFLGKSWDANTGALETYAECLRVLKPGGHILAFSAARTYHHLAITLEVAGFEIRDQIMWIYSSGFPKAQKIKGHEGWKTALKPAHEPIAMARKPFKGSTTDNVLKHGVGALNIDAARVPYLDLKDMKGAGLNWNKTGYETGGPRFIGSGEEDKKVDKPAEKKDNINEQGRFPSNVLGEIPDYQKYFYCPKVNRGERHIGFDTTNIPTDPGGIYDIDKGSYIGSKRQQANTVGNNHPTVKPVALMRYLIKLVTPPNSTVLDPFCGSGSTGIAAVELGHQFIGCELDPNYVSIAETRIRAWNTTGTTFEELFE